MNNKVYLTENKPGVFERNARFKLESNFQADIQYEEINAFEWRVCEKNKQSNRKNGKKKVWSNMSNKEKSALPNLICTKNKSIVRQLGDIKFT